MNQQTVKRAYYRVGDVVARHESLFRWVVVRYAGRNCYEIDMERWLVKHKGRTYRQTVPAAHIAEIVTPPTPPPAPEPTPPAWNPVGQFAEVDGDMLVFVLAEHQSLNRHYRVIGLDGEEDFFAQPIGRLHPTDKAQIARKSNRVSIMVGDKEVARRYNTGKWQSQYEPSLNEEDMLLYAFAIQMVCKHVPLKAE